MISTERIEPPSDEALLRAYAQSNDAAAFETLVSRHAGWVLASASRQLGDRQLAEDAAQAVFTLLCRRAGKFSIRQNVASWLFATTRYTVLGMRRARARRLRHERAAMEARAMAMSSTTTDVPSELAEHLDDAVARLPGRERTAVVLRFYRGLGFAEIALAEGISEAAARQRVSRGVGRLRKRLGGETAVSTAAIGAVALMGYGSSPFGSASGGGSAYGAMCKTALAAKQGSALPAGAAAAMKGAVTAMAIAKAKIAAGAVVAGLLLVTSTAVVVHELQSPPVSAPPTAGGGQSTDATPSPSGDETQTYSLAPGQVLKWIHPPFPAEREAMNEPSHPGQNDKGPAARILQRSNGKTQKYAEQFGGPFSLARLSEYVLGYFDQDRQIDPRLTHLELPGDFIYDPKASPDELCRAMEQLAQKAGRSVRIQIREVERPVTVLRGTWNLRPVTPDQTTTVKVIDIYGLALNPKPYSGAGGGTGTVAELGKWLGRWLNRTVVIEATDGPDLSSWELNDARQVSPEAAAKAHDPALILQHIEEQTGLHAVEETRKVNHLFIELAATPADAALDRDFSRIYSLAPGQVLKWVHPPFPASRLEMYRRQYGSPPGEPYALTIIWEKTAGKVWNMQVGSPVSLVGLPALLLGYSRQTMECDRKLLDAELPGDFVFDAKASPDDVCRAIERVAKEAGKPVRLHIREVERTVTVLKGMWRRRELPSDRDDSDGIQIYGSAVNADPNAGGGFGTGDMAGLANALGDWIDRQVIVEASGVPARLEWRLSDARDIPGDALTHAHDPKLVLQHVEEQTGLHAVEETRKVKRLFIEPADTP